MISISNLRKMIGNKASFEIQLGSAEAANATFAEAANLTFAEAANATFAEAANATFAEAANATSKC